MGKVVLYSTVSVDGFIADENDQPGPLFDWLSSGDVPLDEAGQLKVSQASYEHTRAYWDQIGVTVAGRHVFDLTDGWGGTPPSGIDHVVVVSHRPAPEGWRPEAPFHFVDGVEAAMAKAQELAGDRTVEVAAGDVGGQMLGRRARRRGRHGRRARRPRDGQALLRIGRRTAPARRSRRGDRKQPGAPPALSGAPMTDLRIGEEVALPAGFDAPRHAGRLPTSGGTHSNPAADLGLGR